MSQESGSDCAEPTCLEAVEELYVFLDGELDDERRTLIQGHLDECAPCLSAYSFHDEIKRAVSSGCQSELPEGLRDKVLAALESFSAESTD